MLVINSDKLIGEPLGKPNKYSCLLPKVFKRYITSASFFTLATWYPASSLLSAKALYLKSLYIVSAIASHSALLLVKVNPLAFKFFSTSEIFAASDFSFAISASVFEIPKLFIYQVK